MSKPHCLILNTFEQGTSLLLSLWLSEVAYWAFCGTPSPSPKHQPPQYQLQTKGLFFFILYKKLEKLPI